jgi:hypothetical protein
MFVGEKSKDPFFLQQRGLGLLYSNVVLPCLSYVNAYRCNILFVQCGLNIEKFRYFSNKVT